MLVIANKALTDFLKARDKDFARLLAIITSLSTGRGANIGGGGGGGGGDNDGNAYIALFFTFDGNYIKSYPIKLRHCSELLKAYNNVYSFLRVRVYRPQLQKLDKKTYRDMEDFITEQQAKVQYTPSDMHRTNIAERCIRTWKNHFTSMRSGAPPSFCMANWCRMTDQCNITLNMMRPCTLNPRISAF